jgi:hypothetical protein
MLPRARGVLREVSWADGSWQILRWFHPVADFNNKLNMRICWAIQKNDYNPKWDIMGIWPWKLWYDWSMWSVPSPYGNSRVACQAAMLLPSNVDPADIFWMKRRMRLKYKRTKWQLYKINAYPLLKSNEEKVWIKSLVATTVCTSNCTIVEPSEALKVTVSSFWLILDSRWEPHRADDLGKNYWKDKEDWQDV